MSKYDLLTHDYLLSILHYDETTGVFTWRERTPDMFKDGNGRYTKERNCKCWNTKYAGKRAGHKNHLGRIEIGIDNLKFLSNVLAWFYVYGDWPTVDVDHIDMNKSNDSINNLRLATRSQNMSNRTKQINNTTGYKGVCFDKARNKYYARIKANDKELFLGRFETAEEAHNAYFKAAKELHGEFARFG